MYSFAPDQVLFADIVILSHFRINIELGTLVSKNKEYIITPYLFLFIYLHDCILVWRVGEQNVKGQLINYSGRIVYPASKGRYTVRITLQAGFKVNVLKALRFSSTHGRKTLQYIIITTMYIIHVGAFKMKKRRNISFTKNCT